MLEPLSGSGCLTPELQSFRLINAKEAYEDLTKGGPRGEQPHPEEALVSGETSEGKISGPHLEGPM